jgi:uncharacterized protein YcaQ
MPLSLSREEAVRLILSRQFPVLPPGIDGTREAFHRLGYVQIDTIQVVERAHHHTLFNRVEGYRPEFLHTLQTTERSVFEYWGHAASYLPMRDFRFYLPKMNKLARDYGWEKEWWDTNHELGKAILQRVRDEGPLSAQDFETPPRTKPKGKWADWKPAKAALEILFWRGDLLVSERRGFQRVYDLPERVLLPDTDTRMPDDDELGRFQVRLALEAHGILSETDILFHLHGRNRPLIRKAVKALLEEGELATIEVEGFTSPPLYTNPRYLSNITAPDARTRVLSPFDNLVINRKRLLDWFGFDYTLECYVPAAKRRWGYFVLPILANGRMIGRMDAKAERSEGVLVVKKLWLDDHADTTNLPIALMEFARFNNCPSVHLDDCEPVCLGRTLTKALQRVELQ